ncbi:unnamed protein product [Trichogramma brassicae]|uniref:Uncharacterized protein n=1 Tax=Trichogramma brassicae TaxID=86971 RepID=A0A6H5IRW2_9HYME|nr:unnamed protein product [Trichogramma brassicae]
MKIRLALNELVKTTYKAVQPLQLVLQGPGRKFRGRRELGILFLAMQGSDNYFPRNHLHHCVRRRSRRRERPKLHQARPAGLLDRRLPLRAPQPVAHGCRHAVSRTRLLCSHHGARQALTLARGAHTDNSVRGKTQSHRQRNQPVITVGSARLRQQPKPRPAQRRVHHRPDAIVIKAKDASTYAEILRTLKSEPTLQISQEQRPKHQTQCCWRPGAATQEKL